MLSPRNDNILLLDACCYILLFASGRIEEIVTDLSFDFAVADVAKNETRMVRRGGRAENAHELVPVDWQPLLNGSVQLLHLDGDEEEAGFIELASRLGDGEAATLAIGMHRRFAVATDDWRARSIFSSHAPDLRLLSTLEILQEWCALRGLANTEIGDLLRNVRERGRFLPSRRDPLTDWWTQHYPRE